MRKFGFALLIALSTATAHAACIDDVDATAKQYGVSTTLPKTTGIAESTSEKLAASGGVIAPPSTGDMAAITPALPNPDSMATAPAIAPQTANGGTVTKPATGEAMASTDSQAGSLLMAARQAGEKGNEVACEQGLAKARALLTKTP